MTYYMKYCLVIYTPGPVLWFDCGGVVELQGHIPGVPAGDPTGTSQIIIKPKCRQCSLPFHNVGRSIFFYFPTFFWDSNEHYAITLWPVSVISGGGGGWQIPKFLSSSCSTLKSSYWFNVSLKKKIFLINVVKESLTLNYNVIINTVSEAGSWGRYWVHLLFVYYWLIARGCKTKRNYFI